MPLWFAVTLATVTALAVGVSGILAYILISLGHAAPIMRQRIGRQTLTIAAFGREPKQMVFARTPVRRHAGRTHWADARFS